MEFFEAQEGVYTGEIPAEFGSGMPEEVAAASAARPAPPTSTEEPREEEAQEDRATSTQVGEEEGEAKGDQAVAGYPWCCSSLFGQMERMGGVAPPLGPGISAQAVFEVESEDESWGDWRGVKASLRVAPCTSTKVSSASVDATYASQGRADVGCGNGVNGPSST